MNIGDRKTNESGEEETLPPVDPLKCLATAIDTFAEVIPSILLQGELSNDAWERLMNANTLGPLYKCTYGKTDHYRYQRKSGRTLF